MVNKQFEISETKEQELRDRLIRHKGGNKLKDIMDNYRYYNKKGEKKGWIYAYIGEAVGLDPEVIANKIRYKMLKKKKKGKEEK